MSFAEPEIISQVHPGKDSSDNSWQYQGTEAEDHPGQPPVTKIAIRQK